MDRYKKPLLFSLCLLPIAIIAGFSAGIYQLGTYSEAIISEVVAKLGSTDVLIMIGVAQSVVYTLFCGFFGYVLANKIGLWKPVKIEKKALIVTLAISVVGGAAFSLDYWIFGGMIDGVQSGDAASLTVSGVIASVLYGGIIEEVMMRLFFMSLIAFVIWKLCFRRYDKKNIPPKVFAISNVIAALLFAAGHLPATISMFGTLTPPILFRCFLLNGGFGLVFGWLYRKYGIVYAMTGHASFHLISKLIWLIFI